MKGAKSTVISTSIGGVDILAIDREGNHRGLRGGGVSVGRGAGRGVAGSGAGVDNNRGEFAKFHGGVAKDPREDAGSVESECETAW